MNRRDDARGEGRRAGFTFHRLAYSVHVYTAAGVSFAFLSVAELCRAEPDPRWVFLWNLLAVLVDATDGPLARRLRVKQNAPRIDGRTIDDIVDYLTFTFIPLMLVWRMGWLPDALGWLVAPAMIASLLGFANTSAKQESAGFFLGFPSYWNIYAFYAGLWFALFGPWPGAVVLVLLTVLTVAPVRFVYPNLAPPPWKTPLLVGGALWAVLIVAMLPWYPAPWTWTTWLSMLPPAAYSLLSFYLDWRERQSRGTL